jgi:hypothetical protein
MDKILALFDLFKKGNEVSDADAWKHGTIAVNSVTAFLSALYIVALKYGVNLPQFSTEEITVFATSLIAIVSAVNSVVCIISNKNMGFGTPSGNNPSSEQ